MLPFQRWGGLEIIKSNVWVYLRGYYFWACAVPLEIRSCHYALTKLDYHHNQAQHRRPLPYFAHSKTSGSCPLKPKCIIKRMRYIFFSLNFLCNRQLASDGLIFHLQVSIGMPTHILSTARKKRCHFWFPFSHCHERLTDPPPPPPPPPPHLPPGKQKGRRVSFFKFRMCFFFFGCCSFLFCL